MTSHNPAGYYGLQIPPDIEKEIEELGYFELTEDFHSISFSLMPQADSNPIFDHLGCDADDWYAELGISDRLSLVRWIAEILATKFTQTDAATTTP